MLQLASTMKRYLSILLLFAATGSSAALLEVPTTYSDIQTAIDSASAGDTILVFPGTYSGPNNRDLNFGGKNLVLLSTGGAAVTVIDCDSQSRGITLENGESVNGTLIRGFTIRNGSADRGGGILLDQSTATIRECRIESNTAIGLGGGILIDDSNGTKIYACRISGNIAGEGGGIACTGVEVEAEICSTLISGNRAVKSTGSGTGGGIAQSSFQDGRLLLCWCTIASNYAERTGGGILVSSSLDFEAYTVILAENKAADYGNDGEQWGSSRVHGVCSRIDSSEVDGINGLYIFCNKSDPMFCDAPPAELAPFTDGNFAIDSLSPLAADTLCDNQWPGQIGAFGYGEVGCQTATNVRITSPVNPTLAILSPPAPSPFNPSTTIRFRIKEVGLVHIEIHNAVGQTIRTLLHKLMPAGRGSVIWDGQMNTGIPAPSGVYFATLTFAESRTSQKLVLIR